MAKLDVNSLKEKYDNYANPRFRIFIDENEFSSADSGLSISDLVIEMTAGYEASVASFMVYNTFDRDKSEFMLEKMTSYFSLGTVVRIALGYGAETMGVFYGFVSKVNFIYQPNYEQNIPGIKVSLMDAKGLMMANNHSYQLKSKSYGEAVKEILESEPYKDDQFKKMVKEMIIFDTPDKKEGGGDGQDNPSDETIEIVAESDYEFVVKAAKKFNYDFFTFAGNLSFRQAKVDKEVIIDLKPNSQLIRDLDIEYCISGLVSHVEARGLNTTDGSLISSKKDISNTVSTKSNAKKLIGKSTKVYLDPTIKNKEDADARVASLVEDISYRFGTLDCELLGLPELQPGFFMKISGIGKSVGNTFYLTRVCHRYNGDDGSFITQIQGKAAALETE